MAEDRSGAPEPSGLAEAIEELASGLDEVDRRKAGSAVEFLRGNVLFAVLEGSSLVVHLAPEVADAAVRTPDASRSNRGSDWVSLRPKALDEFALDRARSWFESAHRHAAPE